MKQKYFISILLIVIGNILITVLEKMQYNKEAIVDVALLNDYSNHNLLLIQKATIWAIVLFMLSISNLLIKQQYKINVSLQLSLFYFVAFETNLAIIPHPTWLQFVVIVISAIPILIVKLFKPNKLKKQISQLSNTFNKQQPKISLEN
jgi:hypothetical protein